MDRYIGKRLEGRYDILELIGKGGMANVYRAHDMIDDRTVAVKILRDEFMNNADFLRRFKNESKAIALLNHPNIVRVFDVSFSDTQSIVMEYIDGVTLKEYIEHTGALPWKDAVHFTIQILHALQHAHDKGIVHRDIKPQNIMLLRSGEIKVTDFGIARFARSESRTISDRAIGSVHYISPEQALGEYTDDKSDIYSTGIMLFEMITGKLPFEADTAVSVAIKQIQTPIKNPRELVPTIPIGLEEITLRAVQKEAKFRYQSAAEMIAALEQFRTDPNHRFGYLYATQGQKLLPKGTTQPSIGNQTPKKGRKKMSAPTKRQKSNQNSAYLRIMLLVTLAITLASAGFMGLMVYLNNPFVKTDDTKLPNLIGQMAEEVESLYTDFTFVEETREYSDEFKKGVIMEQKPNGGMFVKTGSTVKIRVSDGMREVEVPDHIGEPASRAINLLRELGLETEQRRVNHDSVIAGRVISMDPAPGTIVSGGQKITVYVSEGPERKVQMIPDLTGLPQDSAIAQITSSGLTLGTVTQTESSLPEGTVISQSPQQGSQEMPGTNVSIWVSKGGLSSYFIGVPLPINLDREVTIRARVGGGDAPAVAAEEVLNPAKSPTGIWSPTFTGEKDEIATVSIYIDGVLYQEYLLDFKDGSRQMTRDRSDSEDFTGGTVMILE